MAQPTTSAFTIGQIVRHLKFGYRGVIYDIDPVFSESEEWYARMARSRPPKDQPWYRVLVDDAEHTTYVAERHLAASDDLRPIAHPWIDAVFDGYDDGRYRLRVVNG